jgi:nitrogen regulatory protein P-II 1
VSARRGPNAPGTSLAPHSGVKKVEAILRPFLLEKLKAALGEIGLAGLTVSDVKGYGRQRGHTELYRGAEYQVAFQPKAKVEIVVRDRDVEDVVRVMRDVAYTGHVGDGKIFIMEVDEAVRIRTGERSDFAL